METKENIMIGSSCSKEIGEKHKSLTTLSIISKLEGRTWYKNLRGGERERSRRVYEEGSWLVRPPHLGKGRHVKRLLAGPLLLVKVGVISFVF